MHYEEYRDTVGGLLSRTYELNLAGGDLDAS